MNSSWLYLNLHGATWLCCRSSNPCQLSTNLQAGSITRGPLININSTVQCSTVQVQCSTVQVQYKYSTSTVRYSTGTVRYSTVQYSTVQCSAVQCSAVQYTAVQYTFCVEIRTWDSPAFVHYLLALGRWDCRKGGSTLARATACQRPCFCGVLITMERPAGGDDWGSAVRKLGPSANPGPHGPAASCCQSSLKVNTLSG